LYSFLLFYYVINSMNNTVQIFNLGVERFIDIDILLFVMLGFVCVSSCDVCCTYFLLVF
jgi:hypothetical protein